MSEQVLDVMKREKRRYSVIHEVATALDEIAALEVDARKQADQIIAEAEAKAAQIVADALNNAKAATDEIAVQLEKLKQDKESLKRELADSAMKLRAQKSKPVKPAKPE